MAILIVTCDSLCTNKENSFRQYVCKRLKRVKLCNKEQLIKNKLYVKNCRGSDRCIIGNVSQDVVLLVKVHQTMVNYAVDLEVNDHGN